LPTVTSTATVTPDQVSVGVLVSAVPRDVIDAAVAAHGAGAKRSGGTLPPHVIAYLTMALCLFPDDDYEEVAVKVTGSLSRFGCWDAGWQAPNSSGISQARNRLGRAVMADVFEGVAQPVATAETRGAWLRLRGRFFRTRSAVSTLLSKLRNVSSWRQRRCSPAQNEFGDGVGSDVGPPQLRCPGHDFT
jgi:hypothetical protein